MNKLEYLDRISLLERRTTPDGFETMSPKQQKLYLEIKNLFKSYPNQSLSRSFINQNIESDTEGRDTFLSDFCYDTVNKEDKANKFCVKDGKNYKFLGLNYKSAEPIMIKWSIRKLNNYNVGVYFEGLLFWNFSEVKKALEQIY